MDFHSGELSLGVLLAFVSTGYFALFGGVAELIRQTHFYLQERSAALC
jgi:hypothetical protein